MNYTIEHYIEDFGFCYLGADGSAHHAPTYMTFRQAADTAYRYGGIIKRRNN